MIPQKVKFYKYFRKKRFYLWMKKSDSKIFAKKIMFFFKIIFCYSQRRKNSNIVEFLPMWFSMVMMLKGCVVRNNKTFEKSKLRRIWYLSDEVYVIMKKYKNI